MYSIKITLPDMKGNWFPQIRCFFILAIDYNFAQYTVTGVCQ